jgi:hypothetical protein
VLLEDPAAGTGAGLNPDVILDIVTNIPLVEVVYETTEQE